jgi:glucokinase
VTAISGARNAPRDDVSVLAVDVGGTKIAVGVVDRGGRLADVTRAQTPQRASADAGTVWRSVAVILERYAAERPELAGVGIGCGGPMIWPAGVVSPLNIPSWRGFPVLDQVRQVFPDVPVRIHNDAVCTAVGEHWRGAGRGADNVLGMVLSTGVGGGLILGGRLIDGASGNAGHVGHIVVEPDGPECTCGGYGCLEAVARGAALVSWATERGWQAAGRTVRDLAADAVRGHAVARAALERGGRAIGMALASATNLCDLEVIAIGGSISQAGPLLFEPLEEAFRRHAAMDYARGVRVVPAALGQEAGLIGAAALVVAGDRYWSPASTRPGSS